MSYAVRKDLRGFRSVADISEVSPEEFYSKDLPEDPIPSKEESEYETLRYRDTLLLESSLRIDPLRDAQEEGVATEDELAKLKLWKDYRIALNRIEGQEGFPDNISWPESPEV